MTDRASAEGLRAASADDIETLRKLVDSGCVEWFTRHEMQMALAALRDHSDSGGIDADILARALASVSPEGTKYPDRLAAEYTRLARASTPEAPG